MRNLLQAACGLAIFAMSSFSPVFAEDPSGQASDAAGLAVLSAVAVPVLATGAGVYASAGASDQLVRAVDSTGQCIGELTADSLREVAWILDPNYEYRAPAKQIPLVARKDYLELHEKVKP